MKFFLLLCLAITFVCGGDSSIPLKFVRANNAFTIHLYEQVTKDTKENIVYSSFSIKSMLALISLGARGETQSEIKNVTNLSTATNEEIQNVFKAIFEELKNISDPQIHTVNRAYVRTGVQIKPEFKRIAEDYFFTKIESIDLKNPKDSAKKINMWIENQTSSKITNVVSEHHIQDTKPFTLLSTQFVRGKWKHSFRKSDTYQADFHNSKTEVVKVDMMKLKAHLMVSTDTKYHFRMLMLPYLNEKADFFIFLPDDIDGLPLIENNGIDMWNRRNFSRKYVEVHLPKFRVESIINLDQFIRNMGITKLVSDADLSGITEEPMNISIFGQKTYVDVDESGTEAPSHKTLEKEHTVEPTTEEKPEVFKTDRPFIFAAMYDGLGLVVGRVNRL